jgi:hypothetical protein
MFEAISDIILCNSVFDLDVLDYYKLIRILADDTMKVSTVAKENIYLRFVNNESYLVSK